MPAYLYRCECGCAIQRIFTVAKMKRKVRCPQCKKAAGRDFVAEHSDVSHRPGNWPMESEALGVLPSQVKEASEYAEKIGVPTRFTAEGSAIFSSAKHRKDYAEAHGFYDKQGGYSDPQTGGSNRFRREE